jgi:MFS family permease
MPASQLRLLLSRRLLPLFVTQFLGAVNDNLYKSALVILIAFRDTSDPGGTQLLVTLAGILFILPYFLFSATAGQLADKFEKSGLIRLVKLWEVGVMMLAGLGFALDIVPLELGILFFLGVQAAFFGPVKYGILPALLATDELMGSNALIEAGTFLAILIGTIAGGLLILVPRGDVMVATLLLALAIGGWEASRFIPPAGRAVPRLRIERNIARETWRIMGYALERKALRLPVLGISWFWFVGAAFLAQFPNYAKDTLGADNQVVTLFLTLFSVGIGIGSLLCGRLLRGEVSTRLVPFGALGMALFSIDLYAASPHATESGVLLGAAAFLGDAAHWHILGDLLAIAIAGGFFIVPLYAVLQARSEESHRSRVVAANNVLNALFMVASGGIGIAMLTAGLSVPHIFLAMGVANGAVAVATFPRASMAALFRR